MPGLAADLGLVDLDRPEHQAVLSVGCGLLTDAKIAG